MASCSPIADGAVADESRRTLTRRKRGAPLHVFGQEISAKLTLSTEKTDGGIHVEQRAVTAIYGGCYRAKMAHSKQFNARH